jgi:hypothetical protein|nr:MAG TPA: hypothetical protein [Caudoviricetes sp.]
MAEPIGSTPVSLEQDIILIREARFGRDVREAIADALTRTKGFVDDVKTEYTTIQGLYEGVVEDVTKLKEYAHDGYSGFVPMTTTTPIGLEEKWLVYQWLDGTTSYDKVKANPSLAGTDIQIGNSVYTYAPVSTEDNGQIKAGSGALIFKELAYEDGATNKKGHYTPCGYFSVKRVGSDRYSGLTLYDEEESIINPDSEGNVEQCAIIYDENYGVNGFVMKDGSKLKTQDLVNALSKITDLENRISALESK